MIVAATLVRVGDSIAQPSTGALDDESARAQQFRTAIEQGSQCFKQGQYDCAILQYQSAYQINPRPPLLFNIAQAHRKAGHSKEALSFYDRFLREDPHSALRPEVQDYVSILRASAGGPTSKTSAEEDIAGRDNFLGTEEQRQALFRQYIQSAVEKFKAGDYDSSIAAYWAAYALKPQPIIVFNAAQAYRKAGRWAEAVTLYERYLRQEPNAPLLSEVQAYIAESKERLQAKQSNVERETAERLAQANTVLAEHLAEIRELDRQLTTIHQTQKPKPVYRRGWFWGLIGAVTVGIALGVGLGVGLQAKEPAPDLGWHSLNF